MLETLSTQRYDQFTDRPHFDRAESRRRVLEKLKSTAWEIIDGEAEDQVPEGWTKFKLDDNKIVIADPNKIELSYVPADDKKYTNKGYSNIGTMHNGYFQVILSPHETELDFERMPDVEFFLDEEDGNTSMMIGTLRVKLIPVASLEDYALPGSEEEYVEVFIERVDDDKKGDLEARNPHIAKHSLFGELRTMAKQLKAMGYKNILATPSDKRRYKIYQRIGMQPIGNEGELFANLDDLINR